MLVFCCCLGSAVEQVAAVFDALSDAKETTRQRVIRLVERLAIRLDTVEAENRQIRLENDSLREQFSLVSDSLYLILSVSVIYAFFHL